MRLRAGSTRLGLDCARRVTSLATSMGVALVRNATLLLGNGTRRVLVDLALDEARACPPVENTADAERNPLDPLPFPTKLGVAPS